MKPIGQMAGICWAAEVLVSSRVPIRKGTKAIELEAIVKFVASVVNKSAIDRAGLRCLLGYSDTQAH